jgi:enterochelin esterase-like enzyme
VSAQSRVIDAASLPSKILKSERNYAVYLPDGYEQSSRSYPVLYLLHGYTDNQTGWVQFGEVQHIADKAIAAGKATPMIIIMPDADTGRPGYTNSIDGKWAFEDFFFNELMPHVENTYRIRKEKRFRAVAGLSMGGGGAFLYAMRHPELFGAAAPLSAWMGPQTAEELTDWAKRSGAKFSEDKAEIYLQKNNPLHLAKTLETNALNSVRWYIDCGDDDFLYEGNSQMHVLLKGRGVNHEYRVRDGGHTWTYWRTALPTVLEFITESFHQK